MTCPGESVEERLQLLEDKVFVLQCALEEMLKGGNMVLGVMPK